MSYVNRMFWFKSKINIIAWQLILITNYRSKESSKRPFHFIFISCLHWIIQIHWICHLNLYCIVKCKRIKGKMNLALKFHQEIENDQICRARRLWCETETENKINRKRKRCEALSCSNKEFNCTNNELKRDSHSLIHKHLLPLLSFDDFFSFLCVFWSLDAFLSALYNLLA